MVDQPRAPVPVDEVGVRDGPVRVRDERVQPDDIGRHGRVDDRRGGRVERQGAGQEVEAEVDATAPVDEVLQLLVGLGVAEPGIDIDEHEVRHRQTQRTGDLAGQPFRHQRARSLARAVELHHVQAIVVRLDETGQRAALTQRRHIAGRGDVARFGHRAGVYRPGRRVQERIGLGG